jgi:CRP-like cAMP-binding protein
MCGQHQQSWRRPHGIGDNIVDFDLEMFDRFTRTFPPDEIIFSEFEPGDTFYIIRSGRVHLIKNAGEYEHTLDILHPSDMFGEMAILENSPRSATAIALDEVKAVELDGRNFEILMMGNSTLAFKLLRMLAQRISASKRRFQILTLPDPQSKIADVFLMLDGNRTNTDKSSDSREFRITTEEVAQWAGISVPQASYTLNLFVSQNRMKIYPDRIIVKNINDFARFVNSKRNHV